MRKLLLMAVIAVAAVVPNGGWKPSSPTGAVIYQNIITVIGTPDEDVGAARDAGAVQIVAMGDTESEPYTFATLTRASFGGTPTAGDRFGAATQLADLNDDNKLDLVVGVPGADRGAGRVYVLLFLPASGVFDLAHPHLIRQGSGGLPGTSEPGDGFGSSLSYTHPSFHGAWLAVGAPGEDVGAVTDAGAVTVVPDGLDVAHAATYYQGNGIPGTPERGDRFGHAVAHFGQGFVAAAPREDVGSLVDAGNVTGWDPEALGSGLELHQGSPGVPGPSEAGDLFGAALTNRLSGTVTIGVPGEDIAGASDAGSIIDLAVPGACCSSTTLWYQGHDGLQGKVEAGDRFGASLAPLYAGYLAVGAPGEDVGAARDAGIVHLIARDEAGSGLASFGNRQYHQDSADVPGTGESGDQMGASLGSSSGSLLFVGMLGEDVHGSADAGAVLALALDDSLGIVTEPVTRQLTQDDLPGSTAEPGDRFGTELGVVY